LIVDYNLKNGEIIEIYNETGQRIPFYFTCSEKSVKISTVGFSRGVYLLKIVGGSSLFTQKVIIL